MLDHATSEMAMGSNLGIDATKKLPGEGFTRNKADYSASEIPMLLPEEFLAKREAAAD